MKVLKCLCVLGVLVQIGGGSQVLSEPGAPENCPQIRKTPLAPPAVYNLTNPLRPTDENIEAGRRLYQGEVQPLACKLCHGEKGDGRGAPDFAGTPPARNFACGRTMNSLSDGQLFWIIRNGSPNTAMPAYTDTPPNDIWKMIHYLRGFSSPR
ncbi:MAG: c-type cytochrome [Nitrospinaceae bacterium]|nr:cytochrome c [Nitrospinaceae bacterium]NIR57924.1 cytochrome c [Nitrospinaceae bacterium]NIS88382.1 cytochrome c [Nitrospinaceae bacterium]NIT85260.1 cytochrome c [Nitrospinaceae bacterium]NIU47413.1 cytochrome c [Nitrospinaceae bacterium]